LLGVEAVAAATEEAVFMAAVFMAAGFMAAGFMGAVGVGVGAVGVGVAAVGAGAAVGGGPDMAGAGAILTILIGVTGAVMVEAVITEAVMVGAVMVGAVTGNSRIGRLPKNSCSGFRYLVRLPVALPCIARRSSSGPLIKKRGRIRTADTRIFSPGAAQGKKFYLHIESGFSARFSQRILEPQSGP
jgi:hypothetical protein